MKALVLTLNKPATEALGSYTRLRVLTKRRGGKVHVALRPSYRVAGKNLMTRLEKAEDGTSTAVLSEQILIDVTALVPLTAGTTFTLNDIGYGWFTLTETDSAEGALVTVSEAPEAAVATETAEATAAVEAAQEAAEGKVVTTKKTTKKTETQE